MLCLWRNSCSAGIMERMMRIELTSSAWKEIIGLVIVERFSRHVGRLFRLSMIGGGASVVLAIVGVPMGLVVGAFLLY